MKNLLCLTLICIAFGAGAQPIWSPLSPWPCNQNLYDLSFLDNNRGWLVGNNNTILKTSNGGNTWQTQSAIPGQQLAFVTFTDAQNGWVVNGTGMIAHSANGGDAWTIQRGRSGDFTVALQFTDAQHGFVLQRNDSLIYTKNGSNWNIVKINSSDDLHGLKFVDQNLGWLCGDNGTLMHTTTGGTSWTAQKTGCTSDFFALDFISATEGWVCGYNVIDHGIVLHTTNGGSNWDTLLQNYSQEFTEVKFLNSSTGFALGDQLYITTNGGKNWSPLYSPTAGINNFFMSASGYGFAIGPVGFIAKTQNNGGNWTQLNRSATNGSNITKVQFTDEKNGWLLATKLIHTADSGKTWNDQSPFPTNFAGYDIHFIDSLTGWIVGYWPGGGYGQILKTINGGKKFTFQLNTGINPFNVVHFCDSLHGITGSNNRYIYRTADGGKNWDSAFVSSMVNYSQIKKVQMADKSHAWALGGYTYKSYILHSGNGGKSWQISKKDTLQFSSAFTAISFVDSVNGYVAGFNFNGSPYKFFLWKTTDAGKNWTQINFPPGIKANISGVGINEMHFTDMLHGWVAGGGFESFILYTDNGGATWSLQENGTAISWYSLNIINNKLGFAAGYDGNIVKSTAANTLSTFHFPHTAPVANLILYPNPAAESIHLQTENLQISDYTILNQLGCIVMQGKLLYGGQTIPIHAISPGIYYLRCGGYTAKFIKE